MATIYARPQSWYEERAKTSNITDRDMMEGFGLDSDQLLNLKSDLNRIGQDLLGSWSLVYYRGECQSLKREHAELIRAHTNGVVENAPEPWRTKALCSYLSRLKQAKLAPSKQRAPSRPSVAPPQSNPRLSPLHAGTPPLSNPISRRPSRALPSEADTSSACGECESRPHDSLYPMSLRLQPVTVTPQGTLQPNRDIVLELLCDKVTGEPSWEMLLRELDPYQGFQDVRQVYLAPAPNQHLPISSARAWLTALRDIKDAGTPSAQLSSTPIPPPAPPTAPGKRGHDEVDSRDSSALPNSKRVRSNESPKQVDSPPSEKEVHSTQTTSGNTTEVAQAPPAPAQKHATSSRSASPGAAASDDADRVENPVSQDDGENGADFTISNDYKEDEEDLPSDGTASDKQVLPDDTTLDDQVLPDDTTLVDQVNPPSVTTSDGDELGDHAREESSPDDDEPSFDDSENEDNDDANAHEADSKDLFARLAAESERNLEGKLAHITQDAVALVLQVLPWIQQEELMRSDRIPCTPWGLNANFGLNPYQVVATVLTFVRERGPIKGGLLADPPGAGKTVQALAYALLNYHHTRNVLEVRRAWDQKNIAQHLSKDAPLSARCPQPVHKQAVACWCEPRNRSEIFHNEEPWPGSTIIMTPGGGLSSFANDAKAMLQGSDLMKHSWAPRIAIHAAVAEKDPMCKPLTADEVAASCKAADWTLQEDEENCHTRFPISGRTCSGSWKAQVSGAVSSSSEATSTRAPWDSSRFIVILTRGCLKRRLTEKYVAKRERIWSSTETTATRNLIAVAKPVLQVRHLWVDECHGEVGGALTAEFIRTIQAESRASCGRNVYIWGASGTPDSSSPLAGIKFCTLATWSEEWTKVAKGSAMYAPLATLTEARIEEHEKTLIRLKELAKTRPNEATEGNKYRQVMDFLATVTPLFQIRRGVDAKWFDGNPLIPLKATPERQTLHCYPSKDEADMVVRIEGQVRSECERLHQQQLAEWTQKGAPVNQKPNKPQLSKAASYHTARATASIASVVKHWMQLAGTDTTQGSTRFVRNDVYLSEWVREPLSQAFTRIVTDTDAKACAKYQEALPILQKVRSTKRLDGTRCKVLVAIQEVGTLAVWHNLLHRAFPGAVVNYTASMSGVARQATLDRFNQDEDTWILLATRCSIKEGLNLQRANHTIIVEPGHNASLLEQLRARTWRRGQSEPVCYFYLLVNNASSIEQRMLKSLDFTEAMQKKFLTDGHQSIDDAYIAATTDPTKIVDEV